MVVKEHIIAEADKLFCQFGIKSITMDDIAKHLGMSKKTIYQYFKDKNALVVEMMRLKMECQVCDMDISFSESINAIQEVFSAVTQMQQILSNMNPMLLNDLQKYHPQAWEYFKMFREKKLFQVIYENLKRGVSEGYYRKEMNLEILTWMRIGQIDTVFNKVTYPSNKHNLSQIMLEITDHFLYGLCTLKGHELINRYKNHTEKI